MIPTVGATCAFEFTSRFSTLDGVYKVRAETTFVDALSSGISFVTNLYTPAGLTEEDFNTDYASYKKDIVVVLESVEDSDIVYYVPESVFGKIPDPTIREYYPFILVVDLGVQKNPQTLLPLIDQVKDLIQASIGTTDPVRVATNGSRKVYLTDAQYAVLEDARAENIEQLVPLSVQLKQAQDTILYLAAKIQNYESLLAQLHGA